jgi:hypothetical protein
MFVGEVDARLPSKSVSPKSNYERKRLSPASSFHSGMKRGSSRLSYTPEIPETILETDEQHKATKSERTRARRAQSRTFDLSGPKLGPKQRKFDIRT